MSQPRTYYFYDDEGSLAHVSDDEPVICIATMDTPCKGCNACQECVY